VDPAPLAVTIGEADREFVQELFPPVPEGIQWGLDRTRRILSSLADPHLAYPVLHVGGTNGKGSVAATLASTLRHSGHRVGLYTSPHLRSFRERIQVGGRPVDEDTVRKMARRTWKGLEEHGASFFEAATVLAFETFRQLEVEVAVVEVGLGGRLDSTNVVHPEVVGITNVAMDHADYLGNTLASIAREKAGIFKRGVPAVTAESDPDVLEIFRQVALTRGTPLAIIREWELQDVEVEADHTALRMTDTRWGGLRLSSPLPGRHQARNVALAVRMLERLPDRLLPDREAVIRGVSDTKWPGRVQVLRDGGLHWVFDVAHNVAGVAALADTLSRLSLPRPLVVLVGILGDKDWRAMLPPLFDLADHVVLTLPPTAPTSRRWNPEEAVRMIESECPRTIVPEFSQALEKAREIAGGGTVVVTGSVHTVGDALEVLDIAPFPE
jgi:dihydrofolate synthase/folylpolyglutamate synthase